MPSLSGYQSFIPPSYTQAQGIHPAVIKRQILESPQEFDEMGTDLGRDAQVWKTYVRDTNQMDSERVDGWNRFVIESSKRLRQDPVDVSAQTLEAMSQTLFSMASGSKVSENIQPNTFKFPRPAVVINALWFLSLSLNVAVSFIAMLAKEWCFKFSCNRVGSPMAQARRRQQRWDKLLQWKMQEVLVVLPVFIHIALLLFAIGLSLFLWDLGSTAVAIPVTVVVVFVVLLYIACTIVPFVDKYCPYSTTASRMYYAMRRIDPQATPDADETHQDELTIRTLYWMITSCENSRSVDIALQSLAAVNTTNPTDLPVKLLEECDTWSLIRLRFLALHPYDLQFDCIASLYARALLTLEKLNYNGVDRIDYASVQPERSCLLLFAAVGNAGNQLEYYARDASMRQLGPVVVHHCLKALRHKTQLQNRPEDNYFESTDNLDLVEYVITLFDRPDISRVGSVYSDISTCFAALLCCSLLHCSSSTAARFIKQFIRAHHSSYTSEFALVLGAFAFSRYDYPKIKSSRSPTRNQDLAARAERALEVVWYCISAGNYPTELAVLGLRCLQAHPIEYQLAVDEMQGISGALSHYTQPTGQSGRAAVIHTLPPSFNVYAAHH
ncbi:transmembrane protein, putative [Rhizoctonia solani AG-3 Rhs1AP]|uniref:Transmembrane protein, putative n=1 Tax=Rhizoctonia solani AG-3 Rhs1AP TaxID=1086054 RepID=X8IYH2_9AGAM|nr:transmembrane protein, putative [Rhizoctonia solani AG-3 Rhs1AP]